MNNNQISALHTRLQYPGVEATFLAAKRWARENHVDPPTRAQVVEVVQKRTAKQVMAKPLAMGGHHASPGQAMYQADIVDMQYLGGSSLKGKNEGYKFIYALSSAWDRRRMDGSMTKPCWMILMRRSLTTQSGHVLPRGCCLQQDAKTRTR